MKQAIGCAHSAKRKKGFAARGATLESRYFFHQSRRLNVVFESDAGLGAHDHPGEVCRALEEGLRPIHRGENAIR